ncbi:MAG TPA: ABC transporter permease [Terriglobia bacterium]|nr:ABC transporter permease [Terriglobia bacterium]
MERLLQDVRYGLRQLRRNPGFTLVAVLTLALGIGANTAIFSVVNAVVLRPLPYPQGDRLLWISEILPALKAEAAGAADYLDWRDQNRTLAAIAAFDDSASYNLTGRGTPSRVHAAAVTANFFATLGVNPALGRAFTADEDKPNSRGAVILMHSFWQQYFGSDAQALGKTVTLDAAPYTVVAVMPASFRFPGSAEVQMLVPLALNEASERLRVQNRLVSIIGRPNPDVSLSRVRGDLDAIHKRSQAAAAAALSAGPMPGTPGPGNQSMMQVRVGPGPAPGGAPTAMREPEGSANNPAPEARGKGMVQFRDESVARGPGASRGMPSAASQASVANAGPQNPAGPTGTPASSNQVFRTFGPGPGGPPGRAGAPSGPGRMMRLTVMPDVELKVVPLSEHLLGNLRPAMLTLLGVVGLVLLIACANVANLMLARASVRTRELSVRAVLGAGRARLVRQLLSESITLALIGGVAGLLLAAWGVPVLTRLIPASISGDALSLMRPHVDTTVLLFALGVSLVTGILFGLAPGLTATRPDLAEKLKEGSPAATAGAGRGVLRGALAVAELSLALVLLIGAGLLVKSFYHVLSIDPGFAPDHVLTMNLRLTDMLYPRPEQKAAFFSEVLRRVGALPGVKSAAVADSLPLTPYHAKLIINTAMATQSGGPPTSETTIMMSRLSVSPAYFYTLGIPVEKGRTFTDADDEHSPKVAVVNQTMAKNMWPRENPIGKQLPLMTDSVTVVGVVADTRHEGLSENVESEIYVPYLQQPMGSMQLALRTAVDPASLANAVRAQVTAIDPAQPIYDVATLEQTLEDSMAPRRFNMLLLAIFAALALALATVGIYGVMAFSVTQRTHEIGIRMALGAERRDVLRLIVRHGLVLTLVGVVFGVGGAWALTRFLTSFLFGVRPTDPATFIVVSAVLVAVSMLASYIPARRATKVDPMVALRYE